MQLNIQLVNYDVEELISPFLVLWFLFIWSSGIGKRNLAKFSFFYFRKNLHTNIYAYCYITTRMMTSQMTSLQTLCGISVP